MIKDLKKLIPKLLRHGTKELMKKEFTGTVWTMYNGDGTAHKYLWKPDHTMMIEADGQQLAGTWQSKNKPFVLTMDMPDAEPLTVELLIKYSDFLVTRKAGTTDELLVFYDDREIATDMLYWKVYYELKKFLIMCTTSDIVEIKPKKVL